MLARFRRSLLAATLFASALFAAPAAQAVGPLTTGYVYPGKVATYSATIVGLTPASAATDFFTITGSASTTVVVREIGCTGTSTAAGSLAVSLIKRSTADLTGTATNPVATPLDSQNIAATAVVSAYTVNPGTLGSLVGSSIFAGLLGTLAPASAGANGFFVSWSPNDIKQAPTLRGVAQTLALNAGGGTFTSAASLTCRVVWTEGNGPN